MKHGERAVYTKAIDLCKICGRFVCLQSDEGSGAKNDANRSSGGSGGLMEEMNALLARRSEQFDF